MCQRWMARGKQGERKEDDPLAIYCLGTSSSFSLQWLLSLLIPPATISLHSFARVLLLFIQFRCLCPHPSQFFYLFFCTYVLFGFHFCGKFFLLHLFRLSFHSFKYPKSKTLSHLPSFSLCKTIIPPVHTTYVFLLLRPNSTVYWDVGMFTLPFSLHIIPPSELASPSPLPLPLHLFIRFCGSAGSPPPFLVQSNIVFSSSSPIQQFLTLIKFLLHQPSPPQRSIHPVLLLPPPLLHFTVPEECVKRRTQKGKPTN